MSGADPPTPGAGANVVIGQGGAHSFQDGVWLSKGEGSRSERYNKWTHDKNKSEVRRLETQQHQNLVRLNSDCLEVRNQLRHLQNDRHQLSHLGRSASSDSSDPPDSQHPSQSSKGLPKSLSTNSLSSIPSGYASPRLSSRRNTGVEAERGGSLPRVRGSAATLGLKNLNPDLSHLKLKNLHSARALSKLNHDMDITK